MFNMRFQKSLLWILLLLSLCVLSAVPSMAAETVTLQPGPGSNDGTDDGSADKGKDAGFTLSPTWYQNDGSGAYIWLFNSSCNIGLYPGFLQFSLNGMPKQNISKAEIQVYTLVYFNGSGWVWSIDPTISLYRLTQAWDEMAVIPSNQPTFDSTVLASHTIDTVGGSGSPYIEFQDWLSFDITDLYKGWADGSITNNGVTFQVDPYCVNGNVFSLYTSDNTDPTLRPKLVVTAECATPPSGMVSWWSGDGHAFDLIDDNDGTLQNGTTYEDGKVSKAFSFDGSDDYVGLPDAASNVINNSAGTLTAWVNPTAIGDNDIIVAYGSGIDSQGIGLGIFGAVRIYHHTGAYDWQSTTAVSANTWTFLAYTWDSTTEYIYKNGAFSESRDRAPINWNYVPGHARIGHGFWGDPANAFPGLIDEVEVYNRALTAEEISVIYNAGSAGKCKPCFNPPSDMVSWWLFDEETGTTANDIIGTNDGTINGATWDTGKVAGALSFDGVNDYVTIPDGIISSTARNFTVDAWVYANSIAGIGENHIVYSGPSGGGEYFLGTRNGNFDFDVFLVGSGWQRIGVAADTGTWRHVTGVRRGTTIEIWVDGVLRNSMSISDEDLVTGAAVHSSIGSYNRGQVNFWNGLIDEVEIFNRALSAEEIAAIYAAGSAGKCKPDTTPDAFTFTDQTNIPLNTVRTSNTITIGGIDSPADISITNCTSTSCEYSIDGGATWTSNDGTVNNGDSVQVRQTSSPNYSTTTDLTLDIGGVSDTFSVTTIAPPTGTRSISGRVKTPGDIPIAGVTITLSGDAFGSTTTNTFGRYRFNGLGNGNYTITPGMAGYIFTPASRTAVISGANVTGRNFTATPGSAPYFISGVVRTSSGAPIEGVTMKLDGDAVVWITTDNRGKYIFTGLANGNYIVTPVKKGYIFTPVSRTIAISGVGVAGRNFTGNP